MRNEDAMKELRAIEKQEEMKKLQKKKQMLQAT